MPNSADVPTAPSAAPIWPPPPTSAPETFTVEDVTVTRLGDQLMIYNGQAKRTFLFGSVLTIVLLVVGWTFGVELWADHHSDTGTQGTLWADPIFLSHVRDKTIQYLLMAPFFVTVQWGTFVWVQGSGRTTLSRVTKSVQVSRRTHTVFSVFVRRQADIIRPTYLVSFRVVVARKSPPIRWPLQFHLRHPENALRLAQSIGKFLDVPVEKGST